MRVVSESFGRAGRQETILQALRRLRGDSEPWRRGCGGASCRRSRSWWRAIAPSRPIPTAGPALFPLRARRPLSPPGRTTAGGARASRTTWRISPVALQAKTAREISRRRSGPTGTAWSRASPSGCVTRDLRLAGPGRSPTGCRNGRSAAGPRPSTEPNPESAGARRPAGRPRSADRNPTRRAWPGPSSCSVTHRASRSVPGPSTPTSTAGACCGRSTALASETVRRLRGSIRAGSRLWPARGARPRASRHGGRDPLRPPGGARRLPRRRARSSAPGRSAAPPASGMAVLHKGDRSAKRSGRCWSTSWCTCSRGGRWATGTPPWLEEGLADALAFSRITPAGRLHAEDLGGKTEIWQANLLTAAIAARADGPSDRPAGGHRPAGRRARPAGSAAARELDDHELEHPGRSPVAAAPLRPERDVRALPPGRRGRPVPAGLPVLSPGDRRRRRRGRRLGRPPRRARDRLGDPERSFGRWVRSEQIAARME